MIIWKGWGILAVVYIALCAGLLGGLLGSSVLGSNTAAGVLGGLGVTLGGIATAAHGWYLNILAPKKRAAQWEAAERPRLEAAAQQGTLVVDNVRPSSFEEAQQLVEQTLERGRRVIGRHGPHSVFWIPMEVIGLIAVVIGLVVAASMGIGALTS